MMPERILQLWIRNALALYAANPIMVEQVFQEEDQVGTPSLVTTDTLEDGEKTWVPNTWQGATLRYQGAAYPIASNTRRSLTVTGALTPTELPEDPYQIVPADVLRLQTYLQMRAVTVDVSYNRIPTTAPLIHLRLESDRQASPSIGESVLYTVDPATREERTWLQTEMAATYLVTIATQNPQETVWLYQLLVNAYLGAQPYFARAGLHDITLNGSDVHPDLAYLPEQVYARYLEISFTRLMQAVLLDTIDQITDVETIPDPRYQDLDSKMDPPMPEDLSHGRRTPH
jgi:hypothetical protein